MIEYLLVTASVGCVFRRHDSDKVNQLLELFMSETIEMALKLGSWLTIIIFKQDSAAYIHLLLKELLVLVLELLENIVIIKKFLNRAVRLVE